MDEETRVQAVFEFVSAYIDGGKFAVFNARNQFLADFDVLDDAIPIRKKTSLKTKFGVLKL